VQTIDGKPTAFVRIADGFEARGLETGAQTEEAVEVIAGLKPGEMVALTNTFVLKSDLGKTRAE
jgi:cobalt-zinc-cadmium efflux system membrane fusion protein